MSRCSNADIFRKFGMNLVTDMDEIEFTLLTDLANCRTINTSNAVSVSGASSFDRYSVPDNMLECNPIGCVNSGTLTLTETGENVVYKAQFDAREFAKGILIFYLKGNGTAGEVQVDISDSSTFTNYDRYTVSYDGNEEFQVKVVNLAGEPASEVGTGWEPSVNGAFLRFTFPEEGSANIGISSISFFESYEDFATVDVVKVGCLTDISGTIDVPAIQSSCVSSGYDTSSLSFTRTINGKTVTPNYHKLNPLIGNASEMGGSKTVTVKKTIEADGTIAVSDINQNECGYIAAQRVGGCDLSMATLQRLYIPATVDAIDEGHFQVTHDTENGTSTFQFAQSMAGQEVLISYPQSVTVRRYAANKNNVGDVRVMAKYTWKHSDGSEVIVTLPNVLVTSFPMNLTRTEQDFSFTITIQADEEGNYYYLDEVVA